MKINRSKLCAIALLTTTLNVVPNLAVPQVAFGSEIQHRGDLIIDPNYVGDFCVLLGPIREYADVILDWGPFQGTRRVYPDPSRPNQIYGVNVYAKGNNVPFITAYTSEGVGQGYPQVTNPLKRCQDTGYGISNPPYLDWSDR
ncbi:hypothetical protein [Laspinema palackyanum]|uniref:hypothetical protein n=1 Tax=Laspinema palackyanum TaxID=3231601 RepID=UPI00345DF50D|nr:hypothetical protein [Laspinema sp. D2c]